MRLNQQRRTKKRLPTRERQSLIVVPVVNAVWALDFMFDSLYSGRAFRTLNVLDEANRGALGIEIAAATPFVYWTANTVSATGKVLTETLGNGAATTRSYDTLDRMTGNLVAKSGVTCRTSPTPTTPSATSPSASTWCSPPSPKTSPTTRSTA